MLRVNLIISIYSYCSLELVLFSCNTTSETYPQSLVDVPLMAFPFPSSMTTFLTEHSIRVEWTKQQNKNQNKTMKHEISREIELYFN